MILGQKKSRTQRKFLGSSVFCWVAIPCFVWTPTTHGNMKVLIPRNMVLAPKNQGNVGSHGVLYETLSAWLQIPINSQEQGTWTASQSPIAHHSISICASEMAPNVSGFGICTKPCCERSHIPSQPVLLSRWFSQLPVWWVPCDRSLTGSYMIHSLKRTASSPLK